ncbi:hypothetical protein [Nocardia panacis]|uniref:hypothetical protein n=1 Tax=Nocardia panacis TaxID=2340916 RepID=UPI0013152996|nr:hypothetical protein [Nocardia panacis]
MTTPNLLKGVETFMAAAEQPIPTKPAVPPTRILAARLLMLFEEFDELLIALGIEAVDVETAHGSRDGAEWLAGLLEDGWRTGKGPDLVEMVDAFLDMAVVAYGGSLETAGLAGTHAAAAEVTRSNLAKILPDGTCLKREDGKVLKPEGWTPPDIGGALTAILREFS